MVHLERDLELQIGYFIRDHQLEDATTMFLYYTQVDTCAKEVAEPSNQCVGIERAAGKANGATHGNGTAGIRYVPLPIGRAWMEGTLPDVMDALFALEEHGCKVPSLSRMDYFPLEETDRVPSSA
ncbi:Glutamine synthetase [Hordeum vulgare]|nr:Glutamine synthetase [Hordeum vulgare]